MNVQHETGQPGDVVDCPPTSPTSLTPATPPNRPATTTPPSEPDAQSDARARRRGLVAWLFIGFSIVALARADGLVAVMATSAIVCVYAAVRWRGPGRLRTVLAGGTVAVALAGLFVGLAVPTYAQRRDPLIINSAADTGTEAPVKTVRGSASLQRPSFDVLGYVASDYEDSAAGVDADVSEVSSLAPTGVTLGTKPGTIEVASATDTLVRAHAAGTTALAVISNFDGNDFNGDRVAKVVGNPAARRLLISALTRLVAQQGWDGVVLDFEKLPPSVHSTYVSFVSELRGALGSRSIDIAVPAFTDRTDPDLRGYDLVALAKLSDRITWMAYDEHELTTAAGPVASLPWTIKGLDFAKTVVPDAKLQLGVAAYGYAWTSAGHGVEYSAREFDALVHKPGATRNWDANAGEWTGRLADGRTYWYSDGRAVAVRAQLALDRHLGGIALWRIGSEEAGALEKLPADARRAAHPVLAAGPSRTVRNVHVRGVVALTFDDGPDPRWTPQILKILRAEHVPATFFVVGQQAQQHQALVRQEMQDGDVVGNHTYSHKDLSKIGTFHAQAEILAGSAVIEGITGRRPILFRSPYGKGDMSAGKVGADQLANDLGEHAVSWNNDPADWSRPGVSAIESRVASSIQERSVVLLHDGGGDRAQTIAALPAVIQKLKAQGYLFTTVDGLDGSIASPYGVRTGLASTIRGLTIIAGFRLWVAIRKAFLFVLMAMALLSLFRLVWSAPLALIQVARQRRWRRNVLPQIDPMSTPMVSIAVPAHNEATVIAKTINSLQHVRHPRGSAFLEILVIDDGSTDNTAAIARAAEPGEIPVRVISQPPSKKAGALNRAFNEARGDIVIVIDADTVADSALVEAMLPHFADPAVGAVAGNVKVGNQRTLFGRLQALEYVVSLNLDRRAQAAANVMAVVPGAAGAFRKSAVLAAGGYSTDTLVEDADLTVTLLSQGWRIPYEPLAIAHTEAPQTLTDVVRQRRRWSYGTVEVAAKHSKHMFDWRSGRVGLLGLPWMLISQVLLPLTGPLTDLFLLYLLLVHNLSEAASILLLAAFGDLVLCTLIILATRENRRLLVYVPLLRLLWRPLQLFAVVASTARWLGGRADGWRKVTRYGSVDAVASRLVQSST